MRLKFWRNYLDYKKGFTQNSRRNSKCSFLKIDCSYTIIKNLPVCRPLSVVLCINTILFMKHNYNFVTLITCIFELKYLLPRHFYLNVDGKDTISEVASCNGCFKKWTIRKSNSLLYVVVKKNCPLGFWMTSFASVCMIL